MLNYFKQKMGGGNKPTPSNEAFYSPMRIALHSTLTLNTVDMITLQDSLHSLFVQPRGDLVVLGIGTMDMDGTTVYQVYAQDEAEEEFVLQIVEGKDFRTGEKKVDEVTLYKQVVTLQPETQASMERALNDIGYMDLELDGVKYDRVWGDQFTEKMDFRKYYERVVLPTETQNFTNEYLLYGREITGLTGEALVEYLLVGLEENADSAQIMMQVGIQLNVSDITVQ